MSAARPTSLVLMQSGRRRTHVTCRYSPVLDFMVLQLSTAHARERLKTRHIILGDISVYTNEVAIRVGRPCRELAAHMWAFKFVNRTSTYHAGSSCGYFQV